MTDNQTIINITLMMPFIDTCCPQVYLYPNFAIMITNPFYCFKGPILTLGHIYRYSIIDYSTKNLVSDCDLFLYENISEKINLVNFYNMINDLFKNKSNNKKNYLTNIKDINLTLIKNNNERFKILIEKMIDGQLDKNILGLIKNKDEIYFICGDFGRINSYYRDREKKPNQINIDLKKLLVNTEYVYFNEIDKYLRMNCYIYENFVYNQKDESTSEELKIVGKIFANIKTNIIDIFYYQ